MKTAKHLLRFSGFWLRLILACSFIVGGVSGCLFASLVQGNTAVQLTDYLLDYMELVESGALSCSAFSVLWHHGRWFLPGLLFGFTVAGVVGIPVLFAVRGFLLAFGISCFARFLGAGGLAVSLCLFGLPAFLWAPGLFLCGCAALSASTTLLRHRTGIGISARSSVNSFHPIAIPAALLLAACTALECFCLPRLLMWVARFLT